MTNVLLAVLVAFSPLYGMDISIETVTGTGFFGHADGEMARFNMPHGVLVDEMGNVYVLDTFNNMVRMVSQGETTTLTGGIIGLDQFGFPLGHYVDGNVDDAMFYRPMGGAIDGYGRIFLADSLNHSIRLIDGDDVFTLAGGGIPGHMDGVGTDALFSHPSDVAIGPCGSLFVADSLNHVIRKIDMYGEVFTIAGIPGEYGYNDGSAHESLFNSPMGIAVCMDGVIFVADTGNHLIRKIEDGYVATLAGQLVFPGDVEWEYPGGDFDDLPIGGFMDGYEPLFSLPTGIAVFGEDIIVADTANHAIRRILPTGYVMTVASGYFHFPRGVFVWEGMIFVADTGNNMVRIIVEVQHD